jgi:hypothetical protein
MNVHPGSYPLAPGTIDVVETDGVGLGTKPEECIPAQRIDSMLDEDVGRARGLAIDPPHLGVPVAKSGQGEHAEIEPAAQMPADDVVQLETTHDRAAGPPRRMQVYEANVGLPAKQSKRQKTGDHALATLRPRNRAWLGRRTSGDRKGDDIRDVGLPKGRIAANTPMKTGDADFGTARSFSTGSTDGVGSFQARWMSGQIVTVRAGISAIRFASGSKILGPSCT